MRWRWGEGKEEERMEEGERTAEEREGWEQLLAIGFNLSVISVC